MNANKAREFFSLYREGTLDAGMRQALERKFREDGMLFAEYELFDRTLSGLESMREAPVEEPFDLFERVSARLDRENYELRRRSPARFGAWWRPLAIGLVAAAAILGAIVSLRGGGDQFTAGLGGVAATSPRPVVMAHEGGVFLTATAPVHGKAVIREGVDGPVLRTYDLAHQRLEVRLDNPSGASRLLSVEGPWPALHLAVPGDADKSAPEGAGTVIDFALAAASRYDAPIVLEVRETGARVQWRLPEGARDSAVRAEITPSNFAFELRGDVLYLVQR